MLATGTITTIAGTGAKGVSGDGGPAGTAQLTAPVGGAFGPDGSFYFADEHRVRRIAPDNTISTVAGTGEQGFGGDNGPATSAKLNTPKDVAVSPDGDVFIADLGNGRVRRVSGGSITTIAGCDAPFGCKLQTLDDGSATEIPISPAGIAIDPKGVIYISTGYHIRRVGIDGASTIIAGRDYTRDNRGDNGPANAAHIWEARGLTLGPDGSVYVADAFDHRVRKISSNGTITTYAGNSLNAPGPLGAFTGDGGPATSAALSAPTDLAFGADGSLYIADAFNNRVRRVAPDGIISTVAGSGADLASIGFSGDGGPATEAKMWAPQGVAVRRDGALYVADTRNFRIRSVEAGGGATAPTPPTPSATPPSSPPVDALCFPSNTAYCISGAFRAQWEQHGGLAINGYPLSGELTETLEDGKAYTVQYFERVRMEYHPENPDPQFRVLLGQFGRRLHPADLAVPDEPGGAYFSETGHNVNRLAFIGFWNTNGGLAQFGYPISEEFDEVLDDGKTYRAQYFERARFEWHPEILDGRYQVLLGQFGRTTCGDRCR